MAENNGNSNLITRSYLDSLLIETRYMNSTNPNPEMELFGRRFGSPIMTAALSHLDHFMFPGASVVYAAGAAKAGAVFWIGMEEDDTIEACAAVTKDMVEIIKPYSDRDMIYKKIAHAEKLGILAVGIDIDHPFGEDGLPDVVDGYEMTALTTRELRDICQATKLPVIAKGVLSVYDAAEVTEAGAKGMVLSHHNNRIEYALPPLMVLPEIRKVIGNTMQIFVDCEIRTGMDAFKALALGANGVCIGRPLMAALKKDGSDGVAEYLAKANAGLRKAMAYTGCTDLSKMDASVVHRL